MFVSQPAGKPPALHICTIPTHAFHLLYVGYFDSSDNSHTTFFSNSGSTTRLCFSSYILLKHESYIVSSRDNKIREHSTDKSLAQSWQIRQASLEAMQVCKKLEIERDDHKCMDKESR